MSEPIKFLKPSERDVEMVIFLKMPEGDDRCTRVGRILAATAFALSAACEREGVRASSDIIVSRRLSLFDSDMIGEAVKDAAIERAMRGEGTYREVHRDPPDAPRNP